MASAASSALLLLLFLLVSTCFLPALSQKTNSSSAAAAAQSPPPQFSFSFNFTNASSYDQSTDILLEGEAKVNGKLIDLTCNDVGQSSTTCTGRMSYRHPVPLHDDTTLASFSTSFTFKILVNESLPSMPPGDGVAFFLTGFPSSMPPRSEGENLGLKSNDTNPYGPQQFVAVEFDTFFQNFDIPDPNYYHIGIDINSVRSINTTKVPTPLRGNMTATIKFDNITQILVASLEVGSYPEPIVVTSQLPDLKTLLPREVAVGFSASTGVVAERHQILTWSFNSTLAPAIPREGHDNKTTMIMIITIIGGLVLLVVVVWLLLSCCKWTNRHRGIETQGKHGPTRFEYQDLAAATDNFSEERKLGQGFFGVVYRGSLKKLGCDDDVAVKKILNTSTGPNENSDFYAELNAITSVKHKNLVKLVGWCNGSSFNFVEFMCWCCKNHNNNKLFLVYELVPKGNLHDHLYKEEALPWKIRYKIVKDITSALHYLHHQCDPFILHRDIKPSNILLDDNFNAKLADFGLSRIVEDNSSKVLTIPVGTEAYLDPQCKRVGKVEFSRSSDVYSFGIALLEIASGMPGSMLLREQVWLLYTRRRLLQAADAKLKGEFDIREMQSVLVLGLWCSYPDNNKRPSMEQVMAVLEHGKPLPDDLNSLDTASVSATELETYNDPLAPTSAASSSYEQMQE